MDQVGSKDIEMTTYDLYCNIYLMDLKMFQCSQFNCIISMYLCM